MKVSLFEDKMKNQVIDLFVSEYKVDRADFSDYFEKFYHGNFQIKKSLMLVAIEEVKVVGFQTFFYWPYHKNNITYNSLQSGNSIIHVDYRGKGIFGKLLQYIDENKQALDVDFIVGFPVDASFNSFIRKGWVNVVNLKWYVKKASLISVFLPLNYKKIESLNSLKTPYQFISTENFKLFENDDFKLWRKGFQNNKNYFCFEYTNYNESVCLECKIQIRKRIIKEVIIGNIISNTQSHQIIENAIQSLFEELKRKKIATILSIAINSDCSNNYVKIINSLKFISTNKKIYFIVKNYNNSLNDVLVASNWELYRGDIDTW